METAAVPSPERGPIPIPPPPTPTLVPPVTEAYQKAHRSYVLASALLGAWQLMGITIETRDKWGITLKSPEAAPFVLFALAVYFGYKTTVEWLQCDDGRKMHPVALLDFRIAHIIAIVSVAIATVQYILQRQILDLIGQHFPLWARKTVFWGLLVGAAYTFMLVAIARLARLSKEQRVAIFATMQPLGVGMFLILLAMLIMAAPKMWSMWPSTYKGLLVAFPTNMLGVLLGRWGARLFIPERAGRNEHLT